MVAFSSQLLATSRAFFLRSYRILDADVAKHVAAIGRYQNLSVALNLRNRVKTNGAGNPRS